MHHLWLAELNPLADLPFAVLEAAPAFQSSQGKGKYCSSCAATAHRCVARRTGVRWKKYRHAQQFSPRVSVRQNDPSPLANISSSVALCGFIMTHVGFCKVVKEQEKATVSIY